MKQLAFLLPPDLQEDGRLLLDAAGWFVQIAERLKREYRITLIVRRIREKQYESIPEGISLLYDTEKPDEVSATGMASCTQVNIRSWKSKPELKGEYDCAIAFQGFSPWCLATTLHRVKAKRKLVYLQRQPSFYLLEGDLPYFRELYGWFDGVLCADRRIQTEMERIFGEGFAMAAQPAPDVERCRALAYEPIEDAFETDTLNLITVDRLAVGSMTDRIPMIAQAVKAEFPQLRWYVMGSGVYENQLLHDVITCNVCDQVQPVGMVENPWPYIRHCDGYVIVDDENQEEALGAKALGVPVFVIRKRRGIPAFAAWLKELAAERNHRIEMDWPDRKIWIKYIEGENDHED